MKQVSLQLVLVSAMVAGSAARSGAEPAARQRALHALGVKLALHTPLAHAAFSPTELESVVAGVRAELQGQAASRSPDATTVAALFAAQRVKRHSLEVARGEAWLHTEAKARKAQRVADGVWLTLDARGKGPKVGAAATVQVHYRGLTPTGLEFESSYRRGTPAVVTVGAIVPCLAAGLQAVAAGGRGRVMCSAALAYGDAGRLPGVAPGEPVMFEFEVLGMEQAQ